MPGNETHLLAASPAAPRCYRTVPARRTNNRKPVLSDLVGSDKRSPHANAGFPVPAPTAAIELS